MCLCVCVFVCVYQNGVIPVLRHLNCCIIIYFFFRILTLLHRRMFRAILLFTHNANFYLVKLLYLLYLLSHDSTHSYCGHLIFCIASVEHLKLYSTLNCHISLVPRLHFHTHSTKVVGYEATARQHSFHYRALFLGL